MRPTAVFDLFHTLVDPEEFRPPGFRRAAWLAERLGIEERAFTSYWRAREEDRNRGRPGIADLLEEYLGGPVPLEGLVDEYGRYQDLALLEPRPSVLSGLRRLRERGLTLGLLSNAEARDVRRWSSSPLAGLFASAHFSCHTARLKPEPAAYLDLLGELGRSPREALFVGDGGSDELAGARRVGFGEVVFMRGFVAHNGLRTPQEIDGLARMADRVVDSIGEV